MKHIIINNILFLDIETVPQYEYWNQLSEETKELYELKTRYQRKEEHTEEEFYQKAGIWAEFGKIICISVGYFIDNKDVMQLRITSFASDNEQQILKDFKTLLNTHFKDKKYILCAHNGKEFDFPYIARRMIIHNMELPDKLNLFGKKPWEIPYLDTLELWKFGDYKHYTSLKLLTHILNIPSPKQDIEGNEVSKVYYKDKNLPRIIAYCERDVIAIAQIVLRFKNQPLIDDENIIIV